MISIVESQSFHIIQVEKAYTLNDCLSSEQIERAQFTHNYYQPLSSTDS